MYFDLWEILENHPVAIKQRTGIKPQFLVVIRPKYFKGFQMVSSQSGKIIVAESNHKNLKLHQKQQFL